MIMFERILHEDNNASKLEELIIGKEVKESDIQNNEPCVSITFVDGSSIVMSNEDLTATVKVSDVSKTNPDVLTKGDTIISITESFEQKYEEEFVISEITTQEITTKRGEVLIQFTGTPESNYASSAIYTMYTI